MKKLKKIPVVVLFGFLAFPTLYEFFISGDLPVGFYTLLRIIVFGSSIYLAYFSRAKSHESWFWIFIFGAILFNPLIPIYFEEDLEYDQEHWRSIGLYYFLVISIFLANANWSRISSLIDEKSRQMIGSAKSIFKRYNFLLVSGILFIVLGEALLIRNYNAYTLGAIVVTVVFPLMNYFLILGTVALGIGMIRKNVKKYWFPVLAWLFFISGLLDVAGKSYIAFVLRPPLDKIVKESIDRGKEGSRRTGYRSLGKCKKVKCYYTETGKCSLRLDDLTRCTDP